jgi:hypothetical protein
VKARGTSGEGIDLRALIISVVLSLCASAIPACQANGGNHQTAHRVEWGVYVPSVDGGSSDATLAGVSAAVGKPAYVQQFVALTDRVPISDLDAVASAGATPLITIEPWDSRRGVDQPQFALRRIAAGAFDDDFQRWGRALGQWRKPLLLRFAHEMNGWWYPWSVGVNGNTADDYRRSWQRMWQVIKRSAPNVEFVWSPNTMSGGLADFRPMYPGASMVDRLGLDGYNWGDGEGRRWQSPEDIFLDSVGRLNALPGDRPILITEVASAEDPNDPRRKADWISDFFHQVSRWEDVDGFVWFQADKERDWRFTSSALAREAFRTALVCQRLSWTR